jgi:hypothetical protein
MSFSNDASMVALKRILQRERRARKAAEEIMEAKSLELYHDLLFRVNTVVLA